MRIHCFDFKYAGWKRWIDLDHIQQISALYYDAHPEAIKQDGDGIDYKVKSHGMASFRYQLAFQTEWSELKIEFPEGRYEYESNGKTNRVNALEFLEKFKAEYEKLMLAWGGVQPESSS